MQISSCKLRVDIAGRIYAWIILNFARAILCSFQCFSILDLEGLTTSQLTSKALAIIKEQAAVDSLCFPETMSRMFIINAPMFFSASWRLIKGWLDPRTASKIDVISNKDAAKKKLLELIDKDQLPVDYGGSGPDTKESLRNDIPGDANKLHTEMMYLRYERHLFERSFGGHLLGCSHFFL